MEQTPFTFGRAAAPLCGSRLRSSAIRILFLRTLRSLEASRQTQRGGGGQLRGLPMIHILALHHPSPLSCYHSYTATTYADKKNKDKNMFVCIDAEIAEKNTHTHRHGDTHS